MSTVLTPRAQSAYPRSTFQSGTDQSNSSFTNRPKTGTTGNRQLFENAFDDSGRRAFHPSALSTPFSRRPRPKTCATVTRTTNSRPASRKLRSDEIDTLLRSLDRDDSLIVEVDCLAKYQTLVQTIDLRRTPLNCHILCALQQRENRIVQRNACNDARFRSLMDILEPSPGVLKSEQQNDSKDGNHSTVSEYPYPPSDIPYGYPQ